MFGEEAWLRVCSVFLSALSTSRRSACCNGASLSRFPKRPMGLTPRPTYQNGSISGPVVEEKEKQYECARTKKEQGGLSDFSFSDVNNLPFADQPDVQLT